MNPPSDGVDPARRRAEPAGPDDFAGPTDPAGRGERMAVRLGRVSPWRRLRRGSVFTLSLTLVGAFTLHAEEPVEDWRAVAARRRQEAVERSRQPVSPESASTRDSSPSGSLSPAAVVPGNHAGPIRGERRSGEPPRHRFDIAPDGNRPQNPGESPDRFTVSGSDGTPVPDASAQPRGVMPGAHPEEVRPSRPSPGSVDEAETDPHRALKPRGSLGPPSGPAPENASRGRVADGGRTLGDSKGAAERHGEYRIGVGDAVLIRRLGSNPKQRAFETLHEVTGNGRIDLGQSRTLRIDGLLAGQVAREIARLEALPVERVEVKISAYNSQFVILYGIERQGRPTVLPFRGREPIADFLARAGCPECLRGYRVRIVRPAEELGKPASVLAVKLDRQFRPDPGSKPVFVESQDFIHLEKDQGRGTVFNRLASRLLPSSSGDGDAETTRLFPWFAEPGR